jgi:hypothetical protein
MPLLADTIAVRDGTYMARQQEPDFKGKTHVALENGADTCIIDCKTAPRILFSQRGNIRLGSRRIFGYPWQYD